MSYLKYTSLAMFLLIFACCKPEPIDTTGVDLRDITYAPSSYTHAQPCGFPEMEIPANNPSTTQGIELGRYLFYDPILSRDSTQSCSSCHVQEHGFSDPRRFSEGVDGVFGDRQSMAIINLGYNYNGFFWDGREPTLEKQAIQPVINVIEMHETWENAEAKLRRSPMYQEMFRKAFGISYSSGITSDLAAKAIAQFERILVSADTKYDKVSCQEPGYFFSEEELEGWDIFFDISPDLPDGECGHCHAGRLFTTDDYRNNGLDAAVEYTDFPDPGLGKETGLPLDYGKFRIPTLRNIEFTAPYMHDGRFATLEEVIEHYNSGGHAADNLDPLVRPLDLTDEHKASLLAFLKTLSDTTFINNPAFSNPFE